MPGTPSTLNELFANRPNERALYEAVEAVIAAFGEVTVRVTKTQVSFAVERQFAWVWLPNRWGSKRPAGSIVVSFALTERIEHPRIVESNEPYPGRWMHHVIVAAPDDVDDTLKGWLTEAYDYGGRPRRAL